jgi:hypothetical protein
MWPFQPNRRSLSLPMIVGTLICFLSYISLTLGGGGSADGTTCQANPECASGHCVASNEACSFVATPPAPRSTVPNCLRDGIMMAFAVHSRPTWPAVRRMALVEVANRFKAKPSLSCSRAAAPDARIQVCVLRMPQCSATSTRSRPASATLLSTTVLRTNGAALAQLA